MDVNEWLELESRLDELKREIDRDWDSYTPLEAKFMLSQRDWYLTRLFGKHVRVVGDESA
jgi:hypothetical protein